MQIYLRPLLFVLCFTTLNLFAQDFASVDAHARSVQRGIDLNTTVQALTAPYTTELEKVRAIFVYVATTVKYDCQEFHRAPQDRKARTQAELLDRAFNKKLGVCAGYAFLFDAMCKAAGITSEVVNGFGRNNPRPPNPDRLANTHAWNAVQIDGQWHLLDATWAAGAVSGDCEKFSFDFSDAYFLQTPTAAFRQHWPADTKWQLFETPRSAEAFVNQPHFYRLPANLALIDYAPANGILKSNDEAHKFRYEIAGAEKLFLVMGERRLEMTQEADNTYTYTLPLSAVRGRLIKIMALNGNRLDWVTEYRME